MTNERNPQTGQQVHQFTDYNALTANAWSYGWVQDHYGQDVTVWVDKSSMDRRSYRYVKQLIKDIDEVTGATVRRVGLQEYGDILFQQRKQYTGERAKYNDQVSGLAYWDEALGKAWATVDADYMTKEEITKVNRKGKSRTKRVLSDFTKKTMAHELLHALGLSHPNDDGHDHRFDLSDTTMSYNHGHGWDGITDMDVAALQAIWGQPSLNTQPEGVTTPLA